MFNIAWGFSLSKEWHYWAFIDPFFYQKIDIFKLVNLQNRFSASDSQFEFIANQLNIPNENGECTLDRHTIESMVIPSVMFRKRIACGDLRQNLYSDSRFWCTPSPRVVLNSPIIQINRRIQGVMTYSGFYPGAYGYDMQTWNNKYLITLKIAFADSSIQDEDIARKMRIHFEQAEAFWNTNQNFSERVQFRFELVSRDENPHIVIPYLTEGKTRGPYNISWSSRWPSKSIIHEIGHILGLTDEYFSTKIGPIGCDETSIMCPGPTLLSENQVKDHHIYAILRRGYCSNSALRDVPSFYNIGI